MLRLSSPVTDLPRIGDAKASVLRKLNITHVRDFLFTFPRKYDDFSEATPIAKLEVGKQQTVQAKVKSVKNSYGFYGRRRVLRVFVELEDPTGTLFVTWYNLRFLAQQLPVGREIYVAGMVEINKIGKIAMRSPAFEFVGSESDRVHTAAITPVYSETHGVTSRFIRYQVKQLLPLIQAVPEYLPKDIIKRHKLIGIHKALSAVHFPKDKKELAAAERRLRFDELFFLQLAALVRRRQQKEADAPAIPIPKNMESLAHDLPFKLTGAQKEALREILKDMSRPHPMNRLLQGDVGSGKSAVALLAARLVLKAGHKVLYLAPTEILARQQYEAFSQALDVETKLLVGAMKERDKQSVKKLLKNTEVVCIIGTHALLQEDVSSQNVGLVIVDEQHRFGVAQRKALTQVNDGDAPHLLSMTATPIPRTLNLTVYGDLDVSVLNELPPGRKPITTKIITPSAREEAIVHVLEELHQGRQGFVVAPLIEESEKLQLKSAKQTYEEMKKWLPGIAVGLVHGQLKSEEKETVMRNFAAGAIQLLVSTAVVEVGVNIPNATMMVIEGAERFGLAQLHQFRGRIGRGAYPSTCYLFPTTEEAARSKRLKIIEQSIDGFKIAEEDLKLRGPGEVYGLQQSGFSDMKVASLLDYDMIKMARGEAEKILKKDPELTKYPILQKKVAQKNAITHFE
ncbi:MAG: ATP-dependent DNA helicase RecG [Candidatus Andersenbacteria bacterium]|nr:ATP-dependent DNA helicase RecG [Candidatus Andersenbacteria bacterium]MBI3250643.1 ATP-dependent DNA helicase RecG [Candidatus Andersenbacteria bacterium]